jgi:hypothetical protein
MWGAARPSGPAHPGRARTVGGGAGARVSRLSLARPTCPCPSGLHPFLVPPCPLVKPSTPLPCIYRGQLGAIKYTINCGISSLTFPTLRGSPKNCAGREQLHPVRGSVAGIRIQMIYFRNFARTDPGESWAPYVCETMRCCICCT